MAISHSPQSVDTSQDPAFNTSASPNTDNVVGSIIDSTYTSRRPEIINEPGGGTGMVQYSTGGAFGGDRNFTYNSNTRTLYLSGNIVLGGFVHGRLTTNLFNLKISGGQPGQQLTTDGTGNLTWADQANIRYGNANIANYLPNYNGEILASALSVPAGNAYIANIISTGNANIAVLNISQSGRINADVSQLNLTGGSNGQVLKTDGTGNLTWADASGLQHSMTLGNSPITLDKGGNSNVWTGPFSTPPAISGGAISSNTTANSLFTFSGTGTANMSLATDGSIFVGANVGTNSYGYDYNEPGWVVVERGMLITDQSGSILFPDGTQQTTAYTGQGGGTASTGNWSFSANHVYNINGGSIDNGNLTFGPTAALSIPEYGSLNPINVVNYYGNVGIVAGTDSSTTKTWSFRNNGSMIFPDGTTQTTAYVGESLEIDGGNAFTVYTAELEIDGGGA